MKVNDGWIISNESGLDALIRLLSKMADSRTEIAGCVALVSKKVIYLVEEFTVTHTDAGAGVDRNTTTRWLLLLLPRRKSLRGIS